MKPISLPFLFCAFASLAFAADDTVVVHKIWNNPTPFLTEIEKQIPDANKNVQADGSLTNNLQMMAYAINQEIMAAKSADWVHPSPVRKAIIEKWGRLLEPYTATLVDLAFGDANRGSSAARQSRSLLDFAAPTEALAGQVRKYIVESSPASALEAADLLFEHRLLVDVDHKRLLSMMNTMGSRGKQLEWARALAGMDIGEAVQFAINECKSILSQVPISNETEFLADYYSLPLGIARLGTVSKELLPGLQLAKGRLDQSQVGLLNMFETAIDASSGRKLPYRRIAKNGSGPLSAEPNGAMVVPKSSPVNTLSPEITPKATQSKNRMVKSLITTLVDDGHIEHDDNKPAVAASLASRVRK